ncbi:MAG TPA: SCO family protein [Stenomitos sp.]
MRREVACLLLLLAPPALAAPSEVLQAARIDQRLGSSVPMDLTFRDEAGRSVRLSECMAGKATVLSLVYYGCPNLCTEVLNGMVKGFDDLPFRLGQEFNVVSVSIDPHETPALAAKKRATYLKRYGHASESSWHFLTGDQTPIRQLADAVGFHYAYDPELKQYAHPSAIVLLTPRGRIARYLFGIDYDPTDLRLGLMEASENRIGSPVDRILMRCYAFDPRTGRYSLALLNLLRGAGVVMVLALGLFIRGMLRSEQRRKEAR